MVQTCGNPRVRHITFVTFVRALDGADMREPSGPTHNICNICKSSGHRWILHSWPSRKSAASNKTGAVSRSSDRQALKQASIALRTNSLSMHDACSMQSSHPARNVQGNVELGVQIRRLAGPPHIPPVPCVVQAQCQVAFHVSRHHVPPPLKTRHTL